LELLGLVNVWFIKLPLPAVAPVIESALFPKVHENVLAVLAVKVTLGLVPLQIVAVFELVTDGLGLMVTVIAVGLPTQEPMVEVGVT
jgi:hypothetical protein